MKIDYMKNPHVVVTEEFAGLTPGTIISVRLFKTDLAIHRGYDPKTPYFFCSRLGDYMPIDETKVEIVEIPVERLLEQPITRVEDGVQNEDGFFGSFVGFGTHEFDYSRWSEFAKRFKSHYFSWNICTDTLVGIGVIKLDGVPICFFRQQYRKSSCFYSFLDRESKDWAHEVLKSFSMCEEDDEDDIFNVNDSAWFWINEKI